MIDLAINVSMFWQHFGEACGILLALLVISRLLALIVRPNWKTDATDAQWLWWSWSGFLVLVSSSIAWTVISAQHLPKSDEWITAVAGIGTASGAWAALNTVHLWAARHCHRCSQRGFPYRWHRNWGRCPGLRGVPPTGVYRSRKVRRGITALTLIFSIAWAALSLTGKISDNNQGYISASIATVSGSMVFGLGLGLRMRLHLEVQDSDGKKDPSAAAYVLQRIQVMGSNRPRGLNAPQGTDVLTLPEQAVSALPEPQSKIVEVLLKVLRVVASISPWQASVTVADSSTATVEIRRNGGQADSTLIFASLLGVRSDSSENDDHSKAVRLDVLTAAGAFLLVRLGKSHLVLTRGLHGATKWRSVACQVLAGTPPHEADNETKERLFGIALQKDPRNEAARLGYVACRAGNRVGGIANERRFVDRLEEIRKRLNDRVMEKGDYLKDDYLPLRMRVLRSLTTARFNLSVLYLEEGDKELSYLEFSYAHYEMAELKRDIETARRKEEGVREFAEELEVGVRILEESLDVSNQIYLCLAWPDTNTNLDELPPRAVYNRACCRCRQRKPDFEGALEDLEFAFGLPELRQEARVDPYLRTLREDCKMGPKVMALLDKPQLRDVDGLRPHALRLASFGIHYADELLERTEGESASLLAESLGVPLLTIEWMRDVCLLIKACPNQRHAVAWTNLLVQEGVDTPTAMWNLLRDSTSKEHALKRVWTVDAIPFDENDLSRWAWKFTFARMNGG